MGDLAIGQSRHVVDDDAHDVVTGDVSGGHDHDLGPVEVGILLEAQEFRVRLARADGRAVPGTGEDDVVGVERLAGELLAALAA